MTVLYGLQLLDTDGTALEPGFGGASYESDTPFPIPNPWDFILSRNRRFSVDNITYEYRYDRQDPNRLIAAATIICRPQPG